MKKKDNYYYDISPEISEETAVWPGDVKYRRIPSIEFEKGGNIFLSAIETTVHLGAHVDAPNHYHPSGVGISLRNLDYYMGPCQVISISIGQRARILPADIEDKIDILANRVLFKTGSFPNHNLWNSDFKALSAEMISYLAKKGVVLVGIDTPSIDPSDDPVLCAHKEVYQNDMAILEGIVLQEVPDGLYQLIALPLKLKGSDASPVRAILLKTNHFL